MVSRTRHRGVALLIVLASMVVILGGTAALVGVATRAQLERRASNAEAIAGDLLSALERPIEHWLVHAADELVLPPDAPTSGAPVLEDRWTIGDRPVELTVTAWDQRAMLPPDMLRSGAPLRRSIPTTVLEILDQTALPREIERFGLDQVRMDGVYPAGADDVDVAGAWIATRSGAALNVNTTPPAVLEAVFRSAGRGGLDVILRDRAAGERATAGEQVRVAGETIRLVDRSDAWSVRIDVRVDLVRRSWWAVYVRSNNDWECVQRLAILN